jgi:co-chaperonin GroES (HSP10)
MSDVGLYGFEIPHDFVRPTRDMVIIRIPFPPEKSAGGIITPQQSLDLMAHNVMAGRIVAMGPLAFSYKDGHDGLKKQDAEIGDWVLIRPFAGTMIQGGQIMVTSGWRYVSSFGDIIGIIPSDKMPDPKTLRWELTATEPPPKVRAQDDFNFHAKKAV